VGNLPTEITSFVGRRREISEATRLLRRHRLLTFVGGAGVGKTRLALRTAARLANDLPGGAWLVELAAVTDEKFLAQTIAEALGVREQRRQAPQRVLVEFLAAKELLLVVDNCEHLVQACAELVNRLLAAAPRLRVLATSRQPLRVSGERLLEVRPLPVPDAEVSGVGSRNEATRLFAERAAAACPGFSVNAGNRGAVVRLCRRLEGIPLAIELAAVRVRGLSLEQIQARLDRYYFDFLTEGTRIAMPRAQTLRAAIDWSFDLCSEHERKLWTRASVLPGGFDLETAEDVCAGEDIAEEDVLDVVAGLVDKSVLVRLDGGPFVGSRYAMLETIREYGAQRLVAVNEEAVTKRRHRDHCAGRTARVAREWLGPGEQEWYTRLGQDHANLRASIESCLAEPGQAGRVLDIVAEPWLFWVVSGRHSEVRSWLEEALRQDPRPGLRRANALWLGGWLALLQADWAAGRSMISESRALAERCGDERARAHTTRLSALAMYFGDDPAGSVPVFEDGLARLRAVDDRGGVWVSLLHLIVAEAALGDAAGVREYGRESLTLVAADGAPTARSWSLWVYGYGRWQTGDREQAGELIREGLRAGQRAIDRWGTAHCLEIMAWLAAERHETERAARLLGAAEAVWLSTRTPLSALRHLAADHRLSEQHARDALGAGRFAALFREGIRLSDEEAVTYALGR
jgi:predicted ATPase